MLERGTKFFASRWGIILVGAVIGILGPVLQKLGNPPNMGICVACFERDITGALGLHRASAVQYIRPEIIGFVLGSTIAALTIPRIQSTRRVCTDCALRAGGVCDDRRAGIPGLSLAGWFPPGRWGYDCVDRYTWPGHRHLGRGTVPALRLQPGTQPANLRFGGMDHAHIDGWIATAVNLPPGFQ